jgi:hypothetical protein
MALTDLSSIMTISAIFLGNKEIAYHSRFNILNLRDS